MTITTAQYRESAREAERLLLWHSAACLWDMAIAAYPNSAGEMAKRDIAQMRERAEGCRRQADSLVAELCAALRRVKFAFDGSVGREFAALIPDTVKDIDAALAKAESKT